MMSLSSMGPGSMQTSMSMTGSSNPAQDMRSLASGSYNSMYPSGGDMSSGLSMSMSSMHGPTNQDGSSANHAEDSSDRSMKGNSNSPQDSSSMSMANYMNGLIKSEKTSRSDSPLQHNMSSRNSNSNMNTNRMKSGTSPDRTEKQEKQSGGEISSMSHHDEDQTSTNEGKPHHTESVSTGETERPVKQEDYRSLSSEEDRQECKTRSDDTKTSPSIEVKEPVKQESKPCSLSILKGRGGGGGGGGSSRSEGGTGYNEFSQAVGQGLSPPNSSLKRRYALMEAGSSNQLNSQSISKKSSIEDFLMLVDMGDLPQPDMNVLSAPLFMPKGGNQQISSSLPPHIQHMQMQQIRYEEQQRNQQQGNLYGDVDISTAFCQGSTASKVGGKMSNDMGMSLDKNRLEEDGDEDQCLDDQDNASLAESDHTSQPVLPSSDSKRTDWNDSERGETRSDNGGRSGGGESIGNAFEDYSQSQSQKGMGPQSFGQMSDPSQPGDTSSGMMSYPGSGSGSGSERGMSGMDMGGYMGLPWQQMAMSGMSGFRVPMQGSIPGSGHTQNPAANVWSAYALQQRQYQQQMYHHYIQQQHQQQQWHQMQQQQFRQGSFAGPYDMYHQGMGMGSSGSGTAGGDSGVSGDWSSHAQMGNQLGPGSQGGGMNLGNSNAKSVNTVGEDGNEQKNEESDTV